MDPITAVGFAAAIAAFIDIGMKIARRLEVLSETGDAPKAFRDVRTRLPLIIGIVTKIQGETNNLLPEAKASFESVVKDCLDQVNELDEIIQKVTVAKGDNKWKKGIKAAISLVEEHRVQRIATTLRDNVQLLIQLNLTQAEKEKPLNERRDSQAPPPYETSTGIFLLPFIRDAHFIGRESTLTSITDAFKTQRRVAIAGIGGVGKSQVAIEYCYRFKQANPDAHVFWVYGGNIARFYQGYKRIAQALRLPAWDDPDTSILELVSNWFAEGTTPFLVVLDNADNIMHYWPGKYKSAGALDDPSTNLSNFLPENNESSHLLITTRDNRVASRLVKHGKPITLNPMSKEEARQLFLSKIEADDSQYEEGDVDGLLHELDYLPLAISQAVAFVEETGSSISEYIQALKGDEAEEFLNEELNDSRRDEDSVNSAFRTWKLSFDQISQQKPRAAELLSLLAMLDRQSIPRLLLKMPEVVTSLGTLQSFSLITTRAGSKSFQLHRLVQRFVQLSLKQSGTLQKWQDAALACVSKIYPTEIGVAEWPLCDALAPHVQIVTKYEYISTEARLDLAHLLCWAADFDIERGMYVQALRRAKQSLEIFQELVSKDDERVAAATWLCGRLQYYEAKSEEDMNTAAETLNRALGISKYPSLNYAESAFELAHLYFDQRNEQATLKMGKASFECWKDMEGPSSVRTLDNMHDYALELAMFGQESEAIAKWHEILSLCPSSNATEDTKTVYVYRSMASIAEFEGDASVAEIFYAKLIKLCTAIYNQEHIHVFDYRLSHAEQVMRQGRLDEAIELSQKILADCKNNSEWQISTSCFQTMAECCRIQGDLEGEEFHRQRCLDLYIEILGTQHRETVDVMEECALCFTRSSQHQKAEPLYNDITVWRIARLGQKHPDTVRILEWNGISLLHQARDAEAEAKFSEALSRLTNPNVRLVSNLCIALWNQHKWAALEVYSRQVLKMEGEYLTGAHWSLITALEQQGKIEEALALRTSDIELDGATRDLVDARKEPYEPPVRAEENRRFGRMIHPRTWSA